MVKEPYRKPTTVREAWENPRYQDKIIVASGGELHGTKNPETAVKLYKRLERKYPQETPVTTVTPPGKVVI